MTKKLLIVIPRFEIGGTNTSLINWCAVLDRDRYQIDIFSMSHSGPLKESFSNINILPQDKLMSSMITNLGAQNGFFNTILSIITKSMINIGSFINIDFSNKINRRVAKKLSTLKYDTVIAFQEGVATKLVSNIKSVNKIGIIRCNYQNYLQIGGSKPEIKEYSTYKSIITVSRYTGSVFCDIIPEYRKKTFAIHNIIDDKRIIKLASEKIDSSEFPTDCFTIVSVGRIDPVKRFDQIPKIAKELKYKTNSKFRWYIVGGGSQIAIDKIKSLAKDYGVEDCVVCLGQKLNPYPYIVASDLVAITSISEACPNILNEAKILGVPPLATDFGSACEFIDTKRSGFISPIEEIPSLLASILNGESEYDKIKNNLSKFKYCNCEIVKQIYEILESK
ncbi:MAG: glycosyltransferase [Acinetobacter sp.]